MDGVAGVFSVAIVFGSFGAWGQEMRPAGWLMLALLAAVVVGTGTAIGGLLKGRAREIAAPMAVVSPAAGVMAVAAALLMFVWLRRTQGSTVDSGLVVTLVGGAGLAVASSVSLARRLVATSR